MVSKVAARAVSGGWGSARGQARPGHYETVSRPLSTSSSGWGETRGGGGVAAP